MKKEKGRILKPMTKDEYAEFVRAENTRLFSLHFAEGEKIREQKEIRKGDINGYRKVKGYNRK